MFLNFITITILAALALFIIIYGFLLIFSPSSIKIFGAGENKLIAVADTNIFPHRHLWGFLFIGSGIYLIYSAAGI